MHCERWRAVNTAAVIGTAMPDELSDEEKYAARLIEALGRRVPSRCHSLISNIGIPLIIAMLAWAGAEAMWTRDAVITQRNDIAWIKYTVQKHQDALDSLKATVSSLWSLQTGEAYPPTPPEGGPR
jgi:hypothetical protein